MFLVYRSMQVTKLYLPNFYSKRVQIRCFEVK
jgi:hypothetical protein